MNSEPAAPSEDAVARAKSRIQIGLPWLIIALAGFIIYGLFNRQVFPAASINYALTSRQAAVQARALASELGYDLSKNMETTTFLHDDDAKSVLEFKLGIKAANELMKNDVPVWLWRTRFCKELSKEQMYIAYTTSGQLKSVFHILENDLKLPSLSKAEAQHLAEEFVAKIGHQDLSKYQLFDYGTEAKPNRIDQHFEWKKGGFPESSLRIRVDISGNKVSSYRYHLAPSDTWTREYKKIRENNELLGKIASFFVFIFIVTTVGAFIYGLNTHKVRWRFALMSSFIVVVLFMLDQGNNWVNTVDTQYDTSLTFANFVSKQVIMMVLMTVGALLMSLTLVGGGEIIYRQSWPKHMAMPYLLSLRGAAQSDFLQKTIYGYLAVGGMMLWVISYYLVGQKFNFFCPLGVDDYKTIGTLCPAVSGALIGVSAAGLEELTCRVVALGLLNRLLKNFWLANFIQAVVWGFAHSQYPQQPSYARGLELTVVGLVFGWIINRYGILPCFVAHYLYDAFLTVEPVFATHQLFLTVPAVISLVPFLAIAMYSKRWAKKKNIAESDLSNAATQAETVVKERHEVEVDRSEMIYAPLSRRWRMSLVAITLLCCGLCFTSNANLIGSKTELSIDSNQALSLAKKYLHEDAVVDDGYQCELELISKPDQADVEKWQYIFEQMGKLKTADLYMQIEPCLEWRARFFKPQESKIYWVFMNADGRKRATVLENSDEGKGQKLTESEAMAVVDAYLRKNRPEFAPYEVVGKNRIERTDRVDYEFELNVPKFDVGATASKVRAGVKGNEISDLKIDWDLPDSWLWPRTTMKWHQQLTGVARPAFFIVLLVAFLGWGIHVLRATSIRWTAPLMLGGSGLLLMIISALNDSKKLLFHYNTAESFQSFIAQTLAQESVKVLLLSFGYFLLALAGIATIRLSFPTIANQLRHDFLLKPDSDEERVMRSNIYIDAAIGSYALCAVLVALKLTQGIVAEAFSPSVRLDIPKFLPAIFSATFPPLDILTAIFSGVILGLMLLTIAAGLWKKFVRTKLRVVLFVLLCGLLMGASSWYWQDCLSGFLFTLFGLSTCLFFLTRVFRMNLLSYVFIAFQVAAGSRLGELLEHGKVIGQTEIGITIAFLVMPLVATIMVVLLDQKNISSADGSK
ncbi:MAG: CPBP family intramembrane metalloprotease [Cyanobacteria bacterium SZAS-4]|nr:CPBP family intramembrane metalloprotease [Cyanobacteria bacterium SZAS-4]